MIEEVLQFLAPQDLLHMQLVCHLWYDVKVPQVMVINIYLEPEELHLHREIAPFLSHSIETGDLNRVMMALDNNFDPNFVITNTGMDLYSLLCGMSNKSINITENGPRIYVKIFKKFRRIFVNKFALDQFGRNCFHHAAIAGNILGI